MCLRATSLCLDFVFLEMVSGEAPAAVKNLKVERSKADKRNAMITWEPVKRGVRLQYLLWYSAG